MAHEARQLRRRQLKLRRNMLAGLLREQLPKWSFRVPAGGLFFWVRLPHGDSREFAPCLGTASRRSRWISTRILVPQASKC